MLRQHVVLCKSCVAENAPDYGCVSCVSNSVGLLGCNQISYTSNWYTETV